MGAGGLTRATPHHGGGLDALKPVVSGFDPAEAADSDPGRLLAALQQPLQGPRLDALSPWRFAAPLAPPMAAAAEGRPLPMAEVVAFCRRRIETASADLVVVEGVGGLMSPMADAATSLDLLEALACRSVLVGGSYLGAVSHTLTALEVMRARGRPPAAVLVSESADPQAPDFVQTVALVAEHAGGAPVMPVRRDPGYEWAGAALGSVFG
jgi:dethiobiotin synthetase